MANKTLYKITEEQTLRIDKCEIYIGKDQMEVYFDGEYIGCAARLDVFFRNESGIFFELYDGRSFVILDGYTIYTNTHHKKIEEIS